MKRKHVNFALLCVVLFLNVIFTQYMVHQYFYENYQNVVISAGINVILFPIAFLIYKQDRKAE